jgi:hypothetical protein
MKSRYSSSSNVNTEDLENATWIPSPTYNPKFTSEFTLAPKTLPNGSYIKKPLLIN